MATGNKLVKEITDQFLHCKICLGPYKDPKTLVCLHTFCSDCLQQHVDSDTNRSSRFLLYNRYITCPLCRRKTEIPTGGVKRLPDNFLVSSLTDVLDRKKISKIPPCEICTGERPRRDNTACHKCLDCAKLLCKACVELHMTTKVTQNHSLIDIEGEKDIQCGNHPEEIVRFYCEPCDECICVVCTFQEHRDHEICSFSDGFTKYKSGLDGLLSQCKERLGEVKNRLSSINKIESTLKETRENIRDLAISYIQQVRSTERQLMQSVDQEFGAKVQGFLQNKEWLQENSDNLQSTCDLAEIIMNDRGIEMLLLKKELQNKLSTLLEPGLPPEPEPLSQNIKFVPGNVRLGYISTENEDDSECDGGTVKHSCVDDNDRPRKRLCVTKDTQTDAATPVPDITAEINFVVPTTTFSSHPNPLDFTSDNNLVNGLDAMESVFKTDVSVNTMCSMSDSKSNLYNFEEPTSPSTCVKCCAELKKDYSLSTGSLPIVDGDPPVIQDIIITNCGETDRQGRRRRRSLIKSRRVQTDVSLSNDDSADELLRASSQESLNGSFRKYSSQNSLPPVAEPVETRTFGTDPIDFGPELKTKSVNTTQAVKVVPEVRSARTNTENPEIRDSTTMTFPSTRTMDTQTLLKENVHKSVATDYAGQRNKRTSTPIIITTDNSTCMPTVTQESKVTWTEAVSTTERSICTDNSEMVETATETMKPSVCDQETVAQPEMITVETNTPPLDLKPQNGAVASTSDGTVAVKERKPKAKTEKDKEKKEKSGEKKEKTGDKEKKEKKKRKEKKKYADCCVATDPVFTSEKETGTVMSQQKDSWTSTVSPDLVNTGVTPERPATREASITTNPVTYMDQGTHTEVVSLQDNTTETMNVVCDSETLTEHIGLQDAQTSVDVFSENVETITDTCHVTERDCMTDNIWPDEDELERTVICEMCQEVRSVMDKGTSPVPPDTSNQGTMVLSAGKSGNLLDCITQTSEIQLYDKCIATSFDFDNDKDAFKKKLDYFDVSTSTDNLSYVGLFSDMDGDELILVPEVAIDLIGSDLVYEKIRDASFPSVTVAEASAQTMVTAMTQNVDILYDQEAEGCIDLEYPIGENVVTVGINTDHILTFEKETCTPSSHLIPKGTNTDDTTKADKSTSTGSSVRAIQEMLGQSSVSDRSSRTPKVQKIDVSVSTDNTLMDEKMIACINKLKNVSERLNSPTRKNSNDSPPWTKTVDNETFDTSLLKELDTVSESERRKNVMELVAKSQAMLKSKDVKTDPGKRKAQPITTLKGKYPEKVDDLSQSTPQQGKPETPTSNSVKMGSHTGTSQKRGPQNKRNQSAPGRIATVPNQAALRKSPKTPPKVPPKTPVQNGDASTLPTPKHDQTSQGPEFYSTVPKTRHSRHGLPMISESRPMSVGSDSSNASYRSAVSGATESTSSSDVPLDLSSLKIKAPPRAPSASPQPIRHAVKPRRETKSAPGVKTAMEVIPTADLEPEARARTGSSSSDQTDHEPHQEKRGFMKKLFGSKKKKSDKRTASPSKSPKPPRKEIIPPRKEIIADLSTPVTPQAVMVDKPKEKPKPFVYMRGRIFSIEKGKDEEEYSKQRVSKYCTPHDSEPPPPLFDFATSFTPKTPKKK